MKHKKIFMKRLLQYMLVCGALLVGVAACKRDLGNYDYNTANTISITTDMATADPLVVITNDSIVVRQNDSLKVNVILSQTQESADLSFAWLITQNNVSVGNPSQYIVGNAQQLKAKIVIPAGLYKLVVKVTDNKTGVSFYKFYSLNVDTAPWGNEGWIVLQDQPADGGCDVSVIASRDGVNRGTVYSNVYSLVNGHKLPAGTFKVNVMNYNATTLRSQKISFFYPNGGVQARSTDFADSSLHTDWFLTPPSSYNLQLNGMISGGQYEYQICNNQFYYRRVNPITIVAPPILFSAPVLGTWSMAPYVIHYASGEAYYTMYDQANKCFVTYNVETNTLIPTGRADIANEHYVPYAAATTNLDPITGAGFDLNKIGKNLVYAENAQLQSVTNAVYDCFFRNNAGDSTWLIQFPSAIAYANNFTSGRFYVNPTKVPGINTATLFACPVTLAMPGKFYYVTGNQVNLCSVLTGGNTTNVPGGYTFPAGTVIKAMKVFKAGYLTTAPAPTDGGVMAVATDETASGGGHKVYFLNIDKLTGTINSTPAQVYTGFDKIIDIVFKKGLGL
jgi:hypothetical protein